MLHAAAQAERSSSPSAATSSSYDQAGSITALASAPAARRRVTGASLQRRLLKKPGLLERLKDPRVVPLGGKDVLRAVCALIAVCGQDGCYDEHVREPSLTPGGLEGRVIGRLKLTNSPEAEEAARLTLDALHRAGLVELSEKGVRLPLPPEELPEEAPNPRQSVARIEEVSADPLTAEVCSFPIPKTTGRPSNGETKEEYDEKVRALQELKRAESHYRSLLQRRGRQRPDQPSILLPMAGKPSGHNRETPSGNLSPPESRIIERFIPEEIGSVADFQSGPNSEASHARLVDVVDSLSKEESSSTTTKSARENSTAVNSAGKSAKAEFARKSAAGPSDELTKDLITKFGWAPNKALRICDIVGSWFQAGLSAEDVMPVIEEAHQRHRREREAGRRGIESVNYIDAMLQEAIAAKPTQVRLSALPDRLTPSLQHHGQRTGRNVYGDIANRLAARRRTDGGTIDGATYAAT